MSDKVFYFYAVLLNKKDRAFIGVSIKDGDNSARRDVGQMAMSISEWNLLKSMLHDGADYFQDGEATIQIIREDLE